MQLRKTWISSAWICITACSAATFHLIAVAKSAFKKFMLPSISSLNKFIQGNIDAIKTVNLLYQNRSLAKDIMLILDMYLNPCVWYSGRGTIDLSEKNELCTFYDQNSIYNETIYHPRFFFLPSIFCFDKNFVVYWLCSLMPSRYPPFLHLRKTAPCS